MSETAGDSTLEAQPREAQPLEAHRHQEPLLEAQQLEIEGLELQALNFHAYGKSLACEGQAAGVVDALFEPKLIRSGSLKVAGAALETCLRSGEAALIPAQLPVPDTAWVGQILLMSARLIGCGASEVDAALTSVGIERLKKRHFKGLSLLEHRLVALAHGLVSEPAVLVLGHVFHHLSHAASLQLLNVLSPVLETRKWIASTRIDVAPSLRLTLLAEQLLTKNVLEENKSESTRFALTTPHGFAPQAYWVRSDENLRPLADALEKMGILLTRGPNPFSLLIRQQRAQDIFAEAEKLSISLTEMCPAESDYFELTRARSGL